MADFKQIDEARKTFGLPESATLEEIKNAYRRLAIRYHPDKCPEEDKSHCEAEFRKVTRARDLLLHYCAGYRFSFRREDVEGVRLDEEFGYDHMKQFYDDWMVRM
ncbi:MAG TPA: J domain-containing protein [bacterium]|nr:J domain-containing protein [bacterium]